MMIFQIQKYSNNLDVEFWVPFLECDNINYEYGSFTVLHKYSYDSSELPSSTTSTILGVFNDIISHFFNTRIYKNSKKWMTLSF